MKTLAVLTVAILFLGFAIFVYAQKEIAQKTTGIDPASELAKSIENGKKLFNDASLGTNGMSCNTCHLNGGATEGMKMGGKALKVFDKLGCEYPKYFAGAKKVMTLDQVNDWCIVVPMKGTALAWDDQRLTDLTAYVASVKAKKVEKKGY